MEGNNVLFTFDSIFDVDMGMLLTIKNKIKNNKNIDYSLYEYDIDFIKRLINLRPDENPLYTIIDDPSKNLYNDLYSSFTDDIIEYSIITDVINMIAIKSNNMNITILCKNLKEEQYCKEKLLSYNNSIKVIINDISLIDTDNFDAFIINKGSDLLKILDKVVTKTVYLFRSGYNLTSKNEIKEEFSELPLLSLIDPYGIIQDKDCG